MRSVLRKIPYLTEMVRVFRKPDWSEEKYRNVFAGDCYGCFFGVFETFEQAFSAVPRTKPVGYDDESLAHEYVQMLADEDWEHSGRVVASHDYPVLFWLSRILGEENRRIFDLGGNVGVHFYSYEEYLTYPPNLKWTVCDVPAIVEAGRTFSKDEQRLTFTDKLEAASGADIFLASGSVQYIEGFCDKLDQLGARPKHLLLNRLPLYDGRTIVTIQNGGRVFYPQFVFNKDEFIGSLKAIGYETIDIWQDEHGGCSIPFHPEVSVPCYYGMYLRSQ